MTLNRFSPKKKENEHLCFNRDTSQSLLTSLTGLQSPQTLFDSAKVTKSHDTFSDIVAWQASRNTQHRFTKQGLFHQCFYRFLV